MAAAIPPPHGLRNGTALVPPAALTRYNGAMTRRYDSARRTHFPFVRVVGALAVAAVAASASPARATQLVIPPGQESSIGEMTGVGARVGGCTMESAAVDKDHVEVTYACGDAGTVTVVLLHPDAATSAVLARTEHFALVAGDGPAPPAALVKELEARIRAAEGDWEWLRVEPKRDEPRPPDPGEGARPPGEPEAGPSEPETGPAPSMSSAWGVAAVVVIGAALALLVGRRRRDS
jgi:hypothetical protein